MKPLGKSEKASLLEATEKYHDHLDLAADYCRARGIDRDTARDFKLGVVLDPTTEDEQARGRLSIPSLGFGDEPYGLTFRAMNGEEPKYLHRAGPTRLYNVRAIHRATDVIAICEGQIDALTLEMCGIPAVGVAGANAWKRHHSRLFGGFSRVLVLGDGDSAGKTFATKVRESIQTAIVVTLKEGEDVNSTYVSHGKDGVLALLGSESDSE